MDYGAYFIFDKPFDTLRAIPRAGIEPIRDRINLRDIYGNGLPDAKVLVSWDRTGIWLDFLSAVPIRKQELEDVAQNFNRAMYVEFCVVPDVAAGVAYHILIKPSGAHAFRIWRHGEATGEKTFACRVTHQVHPQFWECGAFVAFADLGVAPCRPGDVWRFECIYRFVDAYGMRYFSGLSGERPYASGQAAATTHDYKNHLRLYFDDEPVCNTRKLVRALSRAEEEFEALDPKKTAALRAAGDNLAYIALFHQLQEQKDAGEHMALLAEKDAFLRTKAEGRDFSVACLSSAVALKRGSDFFRKVRPLPETIRCRAAKGEAESFQLVLAATPDAAATVSLAWEGESGAPCFEWGEIRDVTAFASFQGPACHGSFSEIILDTSPASVSIPYASYTPVFCRFSVPVDAKSGVYRGSFRISNASGAVRVPVELHVRNFALPVRTTLPVVFSFFEAFYQRWYGLDKIPVKTHEEIFEFLLKYRLSPNDIYSKELYPGIEDLKKFMSRGLNFCTLGYLALRQAELTDEKLEELVAEFRRRWDAVKACGAQDICFFYSYDEIVPHLNKDVEKTARRLLTRFRQEFPGLKCLQTSRYAPELADCFNIWIPTFDEIAESSQRAAAEGANPEFWWYSADGPEKPYPNYFLGYPLLDLRMVMTLSWKCRVKGILHWCVNREWAANAARRQAIEQDPANWDPAFQSLLSSEEVRRCGMGNYMYPAPDGSIYPSLRLENLRDGIEDYEYYALLGKLCAAPGVDPALRAKAETLLAVPPAVARSACDYSADPEVLADFREQVAALIEQLQP